MAEFPHFRSLGGRALRSIGRDPEDRSKHRVGGEWQKTKRMNRTQRARMAALSKIVPNLPRWRLADGLNLSKFKPRPHQLLVSDLLATDWLGFAGLRGKTRTRALVADEGGTGKTLSTAIAVRWICSRPNPGGPVIVLCPPLLKDHWEEHLRATFDDDPDRIRVLSSAKWFDPLLHHDDILVVSKFSWANHWPEIRKHWEGDKPPKNPLCVVVDEAHQGRSKDLENEDEELEGAIGNQGEEVDVTSLRRSVRETCRDSMFAIGVTATPINIFSNEISGILQDLGAEQTMLGGVEEDAKPGARFMAALAKLRNWAREEGRPDASAPEGILEELSRAIMQEWPKGHWADISEEDAKSLSDWFSKRSSEGQNQLVSPGLALRIARELHPYGRHLCMTLRKDVDPESARMFRRRTDRSVRIDLNDELRGYLETVSVYKPADGNNPAQGEPTLPGNESGWGHRTRIAISHRLNPVVTVQEKGPRHGQKRYPGVWSHSDGDRSWESIKKIKDERLESLVEIIRNDISLSEKDESLPGNRATGRGCVIFTDLRGTVSLLKRDIPESLDVDGGRKSIVVSALTGSVDLEEASRILQSCESSSRKSAKYPVLICTSAGEVGLDMPWATSLVHWDLNRNPQRMEQRTWRLDRMVREGEPVTPEFTVFNFLPNGIPAISETEVRINERYTMACEELGLQSRDYIPEDRPQQISQEGSKNPSELISEEICSLSEFLENISGGGWPGRRLKESERLKMATLLEATGLIVDPSKVVDTGRVVPSLRKTAGTILFSDPLSSALRDLEAFHPSLSLDLSLRVGDQYGSRERCCSWEDQKSDETAPLVSCNSALSPLFHDSRGYLQSTIPVVRIPRPMPTGNLVVALNREVSENSRSLALDDSGLRLFDASSGKLFDPKEEEYWEIIFEASRRLLCSGPDGTTDFEGEAPADEQGEEAFRSRARILRSRNELDSSYLERIESKIEEGVDEEEEYRLTEKSASLERIISERSKLIEVAKSIGHDLEPAMLIEMGVKS